MTNASTFVIIDVQKKGMEVMPKTCYYTFGVDHPLAGCVQKIVSNGDPREKMLAAYGTNWCWEYFPDQVTENGDGTVTIKGTRRDYTYKLLEKVL